MESSDGALVHKRADMPAALKPRSRVQVALYGHSDGSNDSWVRISADNGTTMQLTIAQWNLFLGDVFAGCWGPVPTDDDGELTQR